MKLIWTSRGMKGPRRTLHEEEAHVRGLLGLAWEGKRPDLAVISSGEWQGAMASIREHAHDRIDEILNYMGEGSEVRIEAPAPKPEPAKEEE